MTVKFEGSFISDTLKQIRPRTDNVITNIMAVETMDMILHDTKKEENDLDAYFTKEGLLCVNKNCKEGNYYAFDKYGIIIRRKEYNNPKNIYGWTYNEQREPVSIHADQYLIKFDPSKVFQQTIQKLRSKYAKFFTDKSIYQRVGRNLNISFM